MTAVGIDVGKAALDVAIDGVPGVVRFANTAAGIRKLVGRLKGLANVRVVVEATGGYEDAFPGDESGTVARAWNTDATADRQAGRRRSNEP